LAFCELERPDLIHNKTERAVRISWADRGGFVELLEEVKLVYCKAVALEELEKVRGAPLRADSSSV
jgi:hypothetical protein